MLRKLLACLALLTGLTAAGAPAQAEVAHAMAAHVEASASGVSAVRSQVAIVIARPATGSSYAMESLVRPQAEQPAAVPSVRIGSDRARE